MKTILICSQKGGTSKSTTATNLSSMLATRGQKTLLVDGDIQGTSMSFSARRKAHDFTLKVLNDEQMAVATAFDATLEKASREFDYCVIDLGGYDGNTLRIALSSKLVDVAIIPCIASYPDIETLPHMNKLISTANEIRGEAIAAHVLFTRCSTAPRSKVHNSGKEFVAKYCDALSNLDSRTCERVSYKNAIGLAQSVEEFETESKSRNRKGSQEMNSLLSEIMNIFKANDN